MVRLPRLLALFTLPPRLTFVFVGDRANMMRVVEDDRWAPPDDIELTDADVFELVDASFNPNPRTSAF